MAERLTEIRARKELAPARGQTLLWDTDVKGFALRVTPGGAKSFLLDYRADGRQRRITIGSFPDWSVQAARTAAKKLKQEVDGGRDPMDQRHADRQAPTLQDVWERYQAEHLPRKAARAQADERSMWLKIILPRLGKLKIRSIDADHIDELHRDVSNVRGTPVRANRVVEVLRRALNLAIRWKWLTDNPASGVRKNAEEKRNRFLNRTEIAALAQALNEHSEPVSANAIKLLMLTGARRGEVLGATWNMFDLENGIWTKPSAHTKQRLVHRVPLSGPALRLLADIKDTSAHVAMNAGIPASPYVFPGQDGKPLTDIKRSWTTICRKAGLAVQVRKIDRHGRPAKGKDGQLALVWQPNVRIHDLRHSFASILVSAGASLPLIGQMLGHTQVQTTQRYAHLFDDPMRDPNGRLYRWAPNSPSPNRAPMPPVTLLNAIRRADIGSNGGGDGGQYSPDQLALALARLDVTEFQDHGDWLRLMFACHHATDGDGEAVFVDWSASDPQFAGHSAIVSKRWRSCRNKASAITYRTLNKILRDHDAADAQVAPDVADDEFPGIADVSDDDSTFEVIGDADPFM